MQVRAPCVDSFPEPLLTPKVNAVSGVSRKSASVVRFDGVLFCKLRRSSKTPQADLISGDAVSRIVDIVYRLKADP